MTKQEAVINYISENYLAFNRLRHDVISDKLQVRCAHSLSAPHNATSVIGDPAEFRGKENWRNLTDKDINTMVCQKPDTELLHEVAEMLEFADGLYISEITNKSMLIEDS